MKEKEWNKWSSAAKHELP